MVRGCLPAVVVVCAGLVFAGGAAAQQARTLVPTGGMWQSIPYKSDSAESIDAPRLPSATAPSATTNSAAASSAKLRQAEAASKSAPASGLKARPPRQPVAAAAVSEEAPRTSAAARTRELERRLDVLSPGVKLGEPITDPENPSWRRARAGRAGPESNSFSVPLDEKGQSGFIARGYHAQPDVQNPSGNTGATFGLRTRF